MPELPEVETVRRHLQHYLLGRSVTQVNVYCAKLRWPVAAQLQRKLPGQAIADISRRAKYLLLDTTVGSVLIHLGMSGSLRLVAADTPLRVHDHVEMYLDNGQRLRFNDPRRFGCLLWQAPDQLHPLLAKLGMEPLDPAFTGEYLYQRSRKLRRAIKAVLMDQRVVTGVGNIYAAESLFMAGIHPLHPAAELSLARYQQLADAVKHILQRAISQGGTTLRDFIDPEGKPGYFVQELAVYGRQAQPCQRCGRTLQHALINQRSTVWCSHCQR